MKEPEPTIVTLEPWPSPKPGRPYPALVKDVRSKRQTIVVTLENRDKRMAGRMHRVALQKDMYPGNKTNRFASAAGLDVDTVGESIDLRAAIGVTVIMRFTPVGNDYEIEFERAKDSAKGTPAPDEPLEHREETPPADTEWDH